MRTATGGSGREEARAAAGARAGRQGVSLAELILAAWLFSFVLLGLARFAGAQGGLAARSHDRVRVTDLVRTTALVMRAELRYAAAPDLTAGPDSVRLRAIRGSGVICSRDGGVLRVRYRGIRRPDPEKDSVLVVHDSATAGTVFRLSAVVGSDDASCGPGFQLTVEGTPPGRGLVLVFEPGTYHLADGALRYRRGRGGRQPVTETVLADGGFRADPGTLTARLVLHGDSLRWAPTLDRRVLVHFLNPGPP